MCCQQAALIRPGIFPCSLLHSLRLARFSRDKFSEGPCENSAVTAHVRSVQPCTILPRSNRPGNREGSMSNVHRHSDIHRTRRNTRQGSVWNFPYWEVEKTSRENSRDRYLSSQSQKYSTPMTDARPPPPMKLPSSFSLLLVFGAFGVSAAAYCPPPPKSYLWTALLSRSLGDKGVRAAMALMPGAMWAGQRPSDPKNELRQPEAGDRAGTAEQEGLLV